MFLRIDKWMLIHFILDAQIIIIRLFINANHLSSIKLFIIGANITN